VNWTCFDGVVGVWRLKVVFENTVGWLSDTFHPVKTTCTTGLSDEASDEAPCASAFLSLRIPLVIFALSIRLSDGYINSVGVDAYHVFDIELSYPVVSGKSSVFNIADFEKRISHWRLRL
jgi:hypothetical protein